MTIQITHTASAIGSSHSGPCSNAPSQYAGNTPAISPQGELVMIGTSMGSIVSPSIFDTARPSTLFPAKLNNMSVLTAPNTPPAIAMQSTRSISGWVSENSSINTGAMTMLHSIGSASRETR